MLLMSRLIICWVGLMTPRASEVRTKSTVIWGSLRDRTEKTAEEMIEILAMRARRRGRQRE